MFPTINTRFLDFVLLVKYYFSICAAIASNNFDKVLCRDEVIPSLYALYISFTLPPPLPFAT
jgi:hypothetical protein